MKESLLQFIWQYQHFNTRDLRVTTGETVRVLSPGTLNAHQGPDFLGARICVGDTEWAGAVELHVAGSDWEKHAHRTDKNYRNVILHVVWVNDAEEVCVATGDDERRIPTLVLEHRVPKWLLGQYEAWMNSRGFVACQQQIAAVETAVWDGWKLALTEERLQRRAAAIAICLRENHQHWEETCWWLIAHTFGGPVNGAAFGMIAKSLPIALLARHNGAKEQLEALLMGQAGLLDQVFADDYPRWLQREFHHLRIKYALSVIPAPIHFLRMRPGSFPTIRLVQLAKLLAGRSSWFSRIKETERLDALRAMMEVTADDYWLDHYIPDKPAVRRVKRLGEALQDSLLINAFIPLLYAYGMLRNEPGHRDKAIRWLRALNPEKNAVTNGWARLGVGCGHAGDSQALLELKNLYCEPKKCLQCAVGKALLGG